jgi:hypothetical protein
MAGVRAAPKIAHARVTDAAVITAPPCLSATSYSTRRSSRCYCGDAYIDHVELRVKPMSRIWWCRSFLVDAGKKIERALRELAPEAEIQFERIAVKRQQIADWNLPTRPTKKSDSRAKRCGDISGSGTLN